MFAGGKWVRCAECGREYTRTPGDDYYNNTTLSDGVCERCLLSDAGLDPNVPPRVID